MDPELEAADPATAAAWAVVLAQVLPEVKEQARPSGPIPGACGESARVLAEAETVARLVGTGAAGLAQQHAVKLARDAVESLPAGRLPAGLAERAVTAAGSVARVRCLAEGLGGAEHAAALARWTAALRTDREAARALLDETAVRRARTAATARAGVSALAARRPQLERAAELVKRQLVDECPPDGRAAAGLRRRLADARRRRARRAAELVERLLGRVGSAPPEFTRPAWAGPELLAWLRGLTHPGLYTAETERGLAAWYGADPFGLRELPPPPPFLAGRDLSALPAEHLAPLLRRLSLTRPAPTAEELRPTALAREPGAVSLAVRSSELRRWGRPAGSGAPLLPEVTRIPHVVHGIWLGGPMPRTTVFRTNYARAASRYAGKVDFVVWTDVPREAFAAVLAETAPPRGRRDPRAAVRSMHSWAVENGIHLVNIAEVFHADAPMKLHVPYVLEMSKQLPRGYASASDHLRVDIIDRLGGMYADGDVVLASSSDGGPAPEEPLPPFLDRIAGSVLGFTMNPASPAELGVYNDIIVAPAGHPALALWAERARLNYVHTQRELFGGLDAMAAPFVGTPGGALRYIAPCRSGRIHHEVLREAGIAREELPPTERARGYGSELSWARPLPADGGAAPRPSVDEVVDVLARCASFLCWQLIAREGDLYLATVDQVIRRLPDPDAAWTALLSVVAALADTRPEVTSVTDARRKDEGGFERVNLPPEAERLLDRTARPDRWLGAPLAPNGQPALLLDELVSPAGLRTEPLPDCSDLLAPLAEVAVDPLGRVVGLWLRTPEIASVRRRSGRFGTLPAGHLGISLGSLPGADWTWDFGVHPESLARLVLVVGAAGRPVRLTVPVGGVEAQRPFARRLEQLLGQQVELAETDPQERSIVPLLTYRPMTAFTARTEEETTWRGTRGPAGSR